MAMSRKTTIVFGLATLGSALAGDWATTAGLAAVYCSQWVHCTNATSCSMSGEINKYMSPLYALLSPGVKSLPFSGADIVNDQAECLYVSTNSKGGAAAFQAKANELQPGKSSFWQQGIVFCNGDQNGTVVAKRCPFVPRSTP